MELAKVYSESKKYAEKLKQRRPQFANNNAAIIVNDKNEIYAGVAAKMQQNGKTVEVPAETSAFLIMRNSGGVKATNLVVFNLGTGEIIMPAADCLDLMVMASAENENCMICLGRNDEMPLSALRAPVREASDHQKEVEAAKEAAYDIPDEEYEPMEEIRFSEPAPKQEDKPAEEEAAPAEQPVEEAPAEEKAEETEAPAEEEKAEEAEAPAEEDKAEETEAPVEEEKAEEPDEQESEEPEEADEVDKALDAIDAFMDGFDFDEPEPQELTPEDEAKALEEKKERQRAAAEAIEKKLAEKAAAEAARKADLISGVGIDESNPFFEATEDVKPPEEVLAVMSDVQEANDKSLKPEDSGEETEEPQMSAEELLKQAKRRKKVAKSNFLFRKRM